MIFFLIFFSLLKEPEIRVFLKELKEVKIKSEDKIMSSQNTLTPPIIAKIQGGRIIIEDFCGLKIEGGQIIHLKPKGENFLNFEDIYYRGSIFLIENKNKILVINKLPLEDYLKGVVPKEIGPKKYPSLEALKAQAVVARSYGTYKIKKPMHKFYDLCATPACQVYGGASAEMELSTRAVEETRGLILIDEKGEAVEAFYMATCGGHTASGDDIFPLGEKSKNFPSKPCFELPFFEINSEVNTDLKKEGGTLQILWNGNFEWGIKKYFGIKKNGDFCKVFLKFFNENGEGCNDLFSLPLFKDLYISFLKGEKVENLLWELAYKLYYLRGEIKSVSGIFSYILENKIYLLQEENPFCLSEKTLLFLKKNNEFLNFQNLKVYPSDRIELILEGDKVLAIEKQEPAINEYADGRAERAKWVQFLRKEEIAEKLKMEKVEKLEILKKSEEGRVLKLKISGGKNEVILERLDIRFKLGLPEILFEIVPVADGYYFYGSGWGHGVGLCQEGSFGMGAFGLDFKYILRYYYPNFKLGSLNY